MQGYTQQYDAVVTAIREQADPNHYIQFVGCVVLHGMHSVSQHRLALSGRELDWISYFLNASNHQPGIPLDYISFHFCASPAIILPGSCPADASPSSRTDPSTYEQFFPQADQLLISVRFNLSTRAR